MSSEALEQPENAWGKPTKREKQRALLRAWRKKRREVGLCERCGGPRGDDGTQTMCSTCAREQNESILELRARRVEEGLCEKCAAPRGDDGTAHYCRPCAEKQNAATRVWSRREFEEGRCPSDRGSLRVLKLCPVCLYEGGAPLSSLSFNGLLPPPASGNRLEVCVGCESCGRAWHKGSGYYSPRLPEDIKLRNEHVGEEGRGLWLRFTCVDERGRVLVEHEGCSAPGKMCTQWMSKLSALGYLRDHIRGRHVASMCRLHAHDRKHLEEVAVARLRLTAGGNGDGQRNGGAEKKSAGRKHKSVDAKGVEAAQTLRRIVETVSGMKAAGKLRVDATSDAVARILAIGGATGGDTMMRQVNKAGAPIKWPDLRDAIWDDSKKILAELFSSRSKEIQANF